MNRLKKELKKRGIVYEGNEIDILLKGIEYDEGQHLLFFTKDFLVFRYDSAVLDSELRIYDKNLNYIGVQKLYKDDMFGWLSFAHNENE